MSLDYTLLPIGVQTGLKCYIEDGTPTGGFLKSVLSNDLFGAIAKADSTNRKNIGKIVSWIYNNAPRGCWGSPDAVENWLNGGYRS